MYFYRVVTRHENFKSFILFADEISCRHFNILKFEVRGHCSQTNNAQDIRLCTAHPVCNRLAVTSLAFVSTNNTDNPLI